jgi:tetratricopeptide (TPR) repeat protein
MGHYHPLTWISFALDHALWGMDPAGYHLTNVVLHSANAGMYFLVLLELVCAAVGGSVPRSRTAEWLAALGALLFAVHPLRVESVAWVTERRDVLSGFFWLATVLCYLRAHRAGGDPRRWLRWAMVAFVASLASKAWGITLPVLLVVLDRFPLRRAAGLWSLLREKIPFFVAASVFALAAAIAQRQSGAMQELASHDLVGRTFQAAWGICLYLGKTLLPIGLSPLYPLERAIAWTEPEFLAAAIAVIAVSAVLIAGRRRWPALLAGWIAYLVTLAPVLGFTQSGPQLAADRYTYLACLPWPALAVGWLLARRENSQGARRVALLALAAWGGIAVVVLGVAAERQTAAWRDSTTLWQAVLERYPRSSTANYNMATLAYESGRLEDAVPYYERAVADGQRFHSAWFSLGLARYRLGRHGPAREALLVAHEIEPGDALTSYTLALVAFALAEYETAIGHCRAALASTRGDAPAWHVMAESLFRLGRKGEAIEALQRAIENDPGNGDLRRRLDEMR